MIVVSGEGKLKTNDDIIKLHKSNSFLITAESGKLEFIGDMKLVFVLLSRIILIKENQMSL